MNASGNEGQLHPPTTARAIRVAAPAGTRGDGPPAAAGHERSTARR